MTLIDSHCHFDMPDFANDRTRIWQECQTHGITKCIIPGVAPLHWQATKNLCDENASFYYSVGLHPYWIESNPSLTEMDLHRAAQEHLGNPRCCAIGECGLDKRLDIPLAKQIDILQWHIHLAQSSKLPLILHNVHAHNEMLDILRHNSGLTGVIHGFSGSYEIAQRYIQLGFYLGAGGTITYARANKTRGTFSTIPLQSILLETDAPSMPIAGEQGKRNTPFSLLSIANTLAQLRQIPLEEVAQATTNNCEHLFQLSA